MAWKITWKKLKSETNLKLVNFNQRSIVSNLRKLSIEEQVFLLIYVKIDI